MNKKFKKLQKYFSDDPETVHLIKEDIQLYML